MHFAGMADTSADSSTRSASPSDKYEASPDPPTLSACEITGDDSGTRKVLKYRRKKKGRGNKSFFGGPSGEDMVSPADEGLLPAVGEDSIPRADEGVVPPPAKDVILPAEKDIVPPQSEVIVQLTCCTCNVKQLRKNLSFGLFCNTCLGPMVVMKCVGCGTMRTRGIETCTGCSGRFE